MRYVLGFALLLSSFATAIAADKPTLAARAWLGADIVAVVEAADKVESFRIREDFATAKDKQSPDTKRIAGRLLLGKGKPLSAKHRDQLKQLVLSDSSYLFEVAKGCEPVPGVIFRLHHKDRYVDVVLCYECKMWGFAASGGKREKWEDFDPVARQLIKLAQVAFPDDKVIQELE